jgi:hypothetical protein
MGVRSTSCSSWLSVFGASGLVLGSVAVVIASELTVVWRERAAHGQAAENGVSS